jgi:hypothetical protein
MLNGRGKEMKEYKIDLHEFEGKVREVVSEAIQRHAFKLGYEWRVGKEILCEKSPYLFFYKSSTMTHLAAEDVRYFEDNSGFKISAADFLALTPEDVKDAPKEPELKPFDRVLVRDDCDEEWHIDFFEGMNKDKDYPYTYRCLNSLRYHCIPYEGNEHLLGTTENVE